MDENFKEIEPMWKGKWEFKKMGGTDDECAVMGEENDPKISKKCFLSAGAIGEPATASKITLYHYATKSLEDFSEKMHRGSGMSKGSKGMDYFAEISRCSPLATECILKNARKLSLVCNHAAYRNCACSSVFMHFHHQFGTNLHNRGIIGAARLKDAL